MTDPGRPDISDLSELALALHGHESTADTIESVIEFTLPAVDADYAGILFLRPRGAIETMGASDDLVRRLDALQVDLGQGPDLTLLDGAAAHAIVVDDTRTEARWPQWAQAVADRGVRSLLSVRLSTHDRVYGSLNAYARRPHAFDEDDRTVLLALARHAAIAVASSLREEHLSAAIDSRKLIGQAQGILMERFGLADDQAFAVLLRYSQHSNVKLRVVAQQIVTERTLPAAPATSRPDRDQWGTEALAETVREN